MMEIQKGDILLFLPQKLLPKAGEHMGENMSRAVKGFELIQVPAETERLDLISTELMVPISCYGEDPLQHIEPIGGCLACQACPHV